MAPDCRNLDTFQFSWSQLTYSNVCQMDLRLVTSKLSNFYDQFEENVKKTQYNWLEWDTWMWHFNLVDKHVLSKTLLTSIFSIEICFFYEIDRRRSTHSFQWSPRWYWDCFSSTLTIELQEDQLPFNSKCNVMWFQKIQAFPERLHLPFSSINSIARFFLMCS